MIWGCEGIIPSARGYIQNGEPRLGQGCLKWVQFGAGWWFRGLLKTFTVLAERQGGDTRVFGGTAAQCPLSDVMRHGLRQAAEGPRRFAGKTCEARRSYAGAAARSTAKGICGCGHESRLLDGGGGAKGSGKTTKCGEVRYGTAVVYLT